MGQDYRQAPLVQLVCECVKKQNKEQWHILSEEEELEQWHTVAEKPRETNINKEIKQTTHTRKTKQVRYPHY